MLDNLETVSVCTTMSQTVSIRTSSDESDNVFNNAGNVPSSIAKICIIY